MMTLMSACSKHDSDMHCKESLTQAKTFGFLLRYIFFTCAMESLRLFI